MFVQTKTKRYRSLVREVVLRNSCLGAHAIQQAEVGEEVAAGDICGALRRAMQLCYVNLRCKKDNLASERNPDIYSLEAVGILHRATDMEDKYLI